MTKKQKIIVYAIAAIAVIITVVCWLLGFDEGGVALAAVTPVMTPGDNKPDSVQPEGEPGRDGLGIHVPEGDEPIHQGVSIDNALLEQPGLIAADIDKAILAVRPEATPLATVIRQAIRRTTSSIQFKWASSDVKAFNSKVKTKVTGGTVKAAMEVYDPDLFAVTSTILVPAVKVNGKPLMLYVESKSGSTLNVLAVNGTTKTLGQYQVPEIAAQTVIMRLGRAAGEKDVQTESYTSYPTTMDNYCQAFKCQVEVSEWYKRSKKTLDWEKQDVKEAAIYEYNLEMERTFIIGQKGSVYVPGKGTIYTTDGILNMVEGDFAYDPEKAWDYPRLIDLTQTVFTGNNGGQTRMFFMGSALMASISKIELTRTKEVTRTVQVDKLGMKWNAIEFNFGTLLCIHIPMFDELGMSDAGIIIDPQFLYKYVFLEEKDYALDKKKTGEANVDAEVTTEVCGIALKYPKAHVFVHAQETDAGE